ncbi:hypothetical protein BKA70DRAFT_1262968 [Coprinopsis sp. MPI-PUGE-AT-0042]|nr:hypothetical protein BKA70DRAFT_1262968 [Coprinopsis sp. MPI-PUGE-AT-0042]
MDLNFDFDPMDVFITAGGDDDDVEDILARQEEAREALEDQMRKAQAMLSILVHKRDEQIALYREVVEKSQQLGDEVLHRLVAEKADLDAEISLLEQDQRIWERARADAGLEDEALVKDLIEERTDICAKLEDLKARRASVEARLYHIENPVFQRLPPEIVQQIFVHCTFSTGKNKRDPEFFGGNDIFIKPSIEKGPLLFTRICKTWRSLALSLPAIWSSIHVSVGTASKQTQSSPPLPILKQWIERSGSRPLRFQISEARDRLAEGRSTQPSQSAGPSSKVEEEQPDLEAMVKLFIPHYTRWQSARFMLRNEDDIDLVFRDLPIDAAYPTLRDLLIARGSWDLIESPVSTERVTSMLRNSPALTAFRWGNQRFATFSQDVPWQQLQVLQLDCIMSMHRFRYVLKVAPNLRSLSVHVVFGNPGLVGGSQADEEDDAEEVQLKLPNLLELALHYEGRGNDLNSFLTNTTIPHLRSCTLNAETLGTEPHYWPHNDFLSFLRLSGCQLEFLSTHNLVFSDEDQAIELLEALTDSLRHLSVQCDRRCNFMGDKVIRALEVEYALPNLASLDPANMSSLTPLCEAVTSESKVLCPRLEYVSFWNCLATTDGTLSDMVASRRRVLRPPGVANLGSVILTLSEGAKHKSDIAVFDALNDGQWGITYITV